MCRYCPSHSQRCHRHRNQSNCTSGCTSGALAEEPSCMSVNLQPRRRRSQWQGLKVQKGVSSLGIPKKTNLSHITPSVSPHLSPKSHSTRQIGTRRTIDFVSLCPVSGVFISAKRRPI